MNKQFNDTEGKHSKYCVWCESLGIKKKIDCQHPHLCDKHSTEYLKIILQDRIKELEKEKKKNE